MRYLALILIVTVLLVAAAPVTWAQSPCGSTYTVQRGDNLYRIAQRCGVTMTAIMTANPTITNANTISAGQVLVIPGTTPAPTTCGTIYTVQRGDTLLNIARRCNLTLTNLLAANPTLGSGNVIYPGQQLVIPGTAGTPTRQSTIYLVAIGDAGRSGTKIGCDDSLIPVQVTIPNTAAVLGETIRHLLAQRSQYYGQSGLYNALYQSTLALDRAVIENGTASIYLTGQLMLNGACDAPRVEAQLRQIALQFSTVRSVNIYVNGQTLQNALGAR